MDTMQNMFVAARQKLSVFLSAAEDAYTPEEIEAVLLGTWYPCFVNVVEEFQLLQVLSSDPQISHQVAADFEKRQEWVQWLTDCAVELVSRAMLRYSIKALYYKSKGLNRMAKKTEEVQEAFWEKMTNLLEPKEGKPEPLKNLQVFLTENGIERNLYLSFASIDDDAQEIVQEHVDNTSGNDEAAVKDHLSNTDGDEEETKVDEATFELDTVARDEDKIELDTTAGATFGAITSPEFYLQAADEAVVSAGNNYCDDNTALEQEDETTDGPALEKKFKGLRMEEEEEDQEEED